MEAFKLKSEKVLSRAENTFKRRNMGHSSVSAIQALSVTPTISGEKSLRKKYKLISSFQQGSQFKNEKKMVQMNKKP